jgi:hypothetical protein
MQKQSKMNTDYIDVTQHVSVGKFQTIASIILKDGDRRPYCNKYNNSPHYRLDSFDVYLNPVSQFINWSADELSVNVSDYNVIVIQDRTSAVIYHDLILKDNKVVLVCDDTENREIVRDVFFNTYLPAIEKAFHLTASDK